MTQETLEQEVDQVDVVAEAETAEYPQHRRKRRTFTMSDEAYDTLSASAEAGNTNRSRLVEDLILQEHRTVVLSDGAYELLTNSAEAFGTERERLAEELINRCGAILSWQAPAPPPRAPWWQFWKRRNGAASSAIHSPAPVLPAAAPESS